MSATVAPAAAVSVPGARLRSLRLQAGLTLDALAVATGLDKGYLSRLERGLKGPSIATVLKLSAALDVPISQLFGEALSHDAVRVCRSEERRRTVSSGEGGASFEILTQADSGLEAFIVHLDGTGVHEGLFDYDGEEILLVLTGTMELRFADRGFVLEQGDCAQFAGHLPHRLRQIGERPASAMVAVAGARLRSRGKTMSRSDPPFGDPSACSG